MTPEARRARAFAAKALIEDATIKQGWDEIENDIRAQWEDCGTWGDILSRRKRDRLWIELKVIKALRQKLASYAGHAPRD